MSLAVADDRVWVVNATGDPREAMRRTGTIQEFDAEGRLLHAYHVADAVSVLATGRRAWAEVIPSNGVGAIVALSNGTATAVSTFPAPAVAPPGTRGMVQTASGALALGVRKGNALELRFVDAATGSTQAAVDTNLEGLVSLAATAGGVAMAAGNVTAGGVVIVRQGRATRIAGCGRTVAQLAAGPSATWAVAYAEGLPQRTAVRTVAEGGCSPPLYLTSPGGSAQLAVGRDAWVLTQTDLYRVSVAGA